MIFLPLITAAQKPKEKPLVFVVDESLSQPKVILRPYANEFKTKIKGNKKSVVIRKTVARNESPAVYSGKVYSKEEVKQLIVEYSAEYGIASELPLCIAQKESGYQEKRISPSGKYFGVFQYDSETWRGTDESKSGMNVLDAVANLKAAIKYLAIHKKTNPWKGTARGCPPLSFL